jgi:hypothetical protein
MRPAPLFNDALPFMRPHIAGFEPGDRVEIPDYRRPGLMRRGKIIATLPHFNQVVIRTDDGVIVDIQPERVRKIT